MQVKETRETLWIGLDRKSDANYLRLNGACECNVQTLCTVDLVASHFCQI